VENLIVHPDQLKENNSKIPSKNWDSNNPRTDEGKNFKMNPSEFLCVTQITGGKDP
jgi:hypothetical protein